jgi:uncharacterized protein YbbK (DUF523 family)
MYLISACLAGVNSRYDGGNNENDMVVKLVEEGKAILVCPEQLGGLPTPRTACEIVIDKNGERKVINKDGEDKTHNFILGAEETLAIAKKANVKKAILKAKSPSCGCGKIYDGTFSGKLINGNGVTAELLINNDIEVFTENDIPRLNDL